MTPRSRHPASNTTACAGASAPDVDIPGEPVDPMGLRVATGTNNPNRGSATCWARAGLQNRPRQVRSLGGARGPWAYLPHRRRPRDGGRASRQDPSPSDLTARDTARPASALVFEEVATATTGPKTLRHEAHTATPICTRKGPRRYHPPG